MKDEKIKQILKLIEESLKEDSELIPKRKFIPYSGAMYNQDEVLAAAEHVLRDYPRGWIGLGKKGDEFEKKLAKYIGKMHVIYANSGSSASLIAISSLASNQLENRLNKGDEVITTASNFPTTLNPIIQNNLKPVFIDVELGTYNPSIRQIEEAISKNTKLIVLTHTLGNPLEIEELYDLCKKNNIHLIEDTCDALGSKYNGKMCGSFGEFGTFSFYPAHHITTGDGGAVSTDNPQLKKIAQSMRDWGRDCWCAPGISNTCNRRFDKKYGELPIGYDHKYVFSNVGYNLKPLEIQAILGLEQLKKLPEFEKKRKENFNRLYKEFKKYEEFLVLPKSPEKAEPCWFAFPLTVRENAPFNRETIINYFNENNIDLRMLFSGNILKHPAYQGLECKIVGDLKNSDTIMNNSFFLGVYPGIKSKEMDYIVGKIDEFMKKY